MSSPATATSYGSFVDFESHSGAAPETSGSLYLSGAAGSELMRMNVGLSAAGNVTAVGSFIIGSADMDETDLEKLDGITNGTAAANKALVIDASKDLAGLRNLDLDGDMTAATITMTGFTVDADGDTALKSLAVDDGSTIGCDSDTDLMSLADGALTVNGTLSADTSFTLDAVTVDATELGYLDGVTAGTAAASKALVLDANGAIGTISHLTASRAKIDILDVNEINSVTRTETTLEVVDKLIIAGSGSASADAADGGLQIGGSGGSDTVASVLYDHANTALDFNIGGTTEVRLQDGVLRPETNNDVDLGASGAQFKDLYIDGAAYIDQLGEALDANSQNITGVGTFSAGASTVTSLSVTDGNITNVGDIALDSISADGNDITVSLTDNREAAFSFSEAGFGAYLTLATSNGEERVQFNKNLDVREQIQMVDDKIISFGTDEAGTGVSGSLQYVAASDILELSGSGANGIRVSGSLSLTGGGGGTYGIEAGEASFAATTVTSLSVTDGNITNVGDIALDSISADGTDIDLLMTDNSETALEIKEGSNVYLQFDTSNGMEGIFAKKEFEFQAGANVDDNQVIGFGTDEADTGASGSLKYVAADDVFEISGSGANGLSFSGSANFNGYGIEAGQASFLATTVNSLSVRDGNITNVGDINCDSVSVDDAAVGLDIVFGGNTTLNKMTLTDNLADALNINEGGNSYLKFVTTNGQEEITAGKELVLSQGGLVADDQSLVFGDDDDGSISFVSAANVVRFDGGSSGLHFNDTSVFGADGSGKDVSFHGADANELMKYTAADHQLKFVDSSGTDHITLGGDATGEFAIDVADGSNNKNKIRAAAFVTYSDERLKTDVSAIQNGLETVNNLKAVNFTWKKDGSRDFGFMAQELKQVIPQAVHGSEEGLYGVDYGRLSAILVSAIQEQSAQIASLKKQLEDK